MEQNEPPSEPSKVSTYPLPKALQQRLYAAATIQQHVAIDNNIPSVRLDSLEDALAHLVGNAIQALDAWYFDNDNMPPHVRRHPALAHRLCLRVYADTERHTLSITDYGIGMTRGDLINSLGVGGRASMLSVIAGIGTTNNNNNTSSSSDNTHNSSGDNTHEKYNGNDDIKPVKEEETNDNDVSSTSTESDNSDSDSNGNCDAGNSASNAAVISCRSTDLGGFYAALCALGVGVQVATQSKFDDYYEVEIGVFQHNNNNDGTSNGATVKVAPNSYEHLTIRRPHPEGTVLTATTAGHDKFHNVRGESGTCVTLHLNETAKEAKFDDEDVLKAIFLKIVETTQYTVAFSSDKDQAERIIAASAAEQVQREVWIKEKEEQQTIESSQLNALEAVTLELQANGESSTTTRTTASVKTRAQFIPLRLSLKARKMLRLVEASMHCCEYTTNVDRPFKIAARRTHAQLQGVTSILRGLVIACDYEAGQKLWQDDDFTPYKKFFRSMFEIARRHKIMNPEKMRTEYGKLIYLLQDAVSPTVLPHLGFSVKGPIESVYKFLEDRGGANLLDDPLIETATEEILAEKKTREVINQEIKRKEKAVRYLKNRYSSSKLSADDIHLCLYSICDNNSFLNSNRVPIDKIIDFLTSNFSPDHIEEGYSLSIVKGTDGSRLSHSHKRQYYYALQSLTLWRDIVDDMFRLWAMAEDDLLSENITYSLQDTGQGMQRVQPSPRTYKAMQYIFQQVQRKVGHWVGSTMIHLGDHNVPNALSFIDKYTQVPRILGPIVSCLDNLERICEKDKGINTLVNTGFGGVEKLKKDILYDFFKSAFDGSGADNFYDAGSCIDGRLTSAWNWCSQLPNKPFYVIFKLTGFTGFDGEFK